MATATVAIPPEAQKRSEAGAEAFARFYLHQVSLASRAGSTSILKGLAAPTCSGCAALHQVVADLEANHQHVDIDSLQLAASRIHPGSSSSRRPVVNVLAEDRPKRIIGKDGSVVANMKGAKFDFQIELFWNLAMWQLASLKVVR